ncbi:MAG: M20/M25/M40 family metallo-hydrolase [Actinomycetes bacterium]
MSLGSPIDPGDLFEELCSIPSPSLGEAAVGRTVCGLLDQIGIPWETDGAAAKLGGDQDNIHAVLPGADGATEGGILLAAHLDTVPPGDSLRPILDGGVWRNAGDGILGADNKAAVTAVVCAAAAWASVRPKVPVEILFTVAEEIGLLGAHAFPLDRLSSRLAFVFDHPSPLGTFVEVSPGHTRVAVGIRGRTAHAGVRPEEGANAIRAAAKAIAAIPNGRLSESSTANVGLISGGTAGNVVPANCEFEFEIRSAEEGDAASILLEATDATQAAADSEGCSADLGVSRSFSGYRHSDSHPALKVGSAALESLGLEPLGVASGGGSDGNVFEAAGIPTLNFGDGSIDTHTPDERISDSDLRRLVELTLALPELA